MASALCRRSMWACPCGLDSTRLSATGSPGRCASRPFGDDPSRDYLPPAVRACRARLQGRAHKGFWLPPPRQARRYPPKKVTESNSGGAGTEAVRFDEGRAVANASAAPYSIFLKISLTPPTRLPILMIVEIIGRHYRGKESCTRRPLGAQPGDPARPVPAPRHSGTKRAIGRGHRRASECPAILTHFPSQPSRPRRFDHAAPVEPATHLLGRIRHDEQSVDLPDRELLRARYRMHSGLQSR